MGVGEEDHVRHPNSLEKGQGKTATGSKREIEATLISLLFLHFQNEHGSRQIKCVCFTKKKEGRKVREFLFPYWMQNGPQK